MNRIVPTFATAIALALAPAPAFAAPATEPAAAPPATEPAAAPVDPISEAKTWHLEADAKYNTADYEGAITSWQKAFAALPRTPEANTYRSLILYNIAAAREKLFALRGDVEQLKQAKILLEQFEASIAETYAAAPEQGEQERARVQEKLAAIDAQIAQSEAEPDPEPEPKPTATPTTNEPVTNPPPTDAPATPSKTPARTYFIAGGVLAGLGVAAGAGMVAALVVGRRANDIDGLDDRDFAGRETQFDRGRRANIAAFATGALSGVLLTAGVAMLVVGAKRRPARTAVSPVVGRGLAGITLAGRF